MSIGFVRAESGVIAYGIDGHGTITQNPLSSLHSKAVEVDGRIVVLFTGQLTPWFTLAQTVKMSDPNVTVKGLAVFIAGELDNLWPSFSHLTNPETYCLVCGFDKKIHFSSWVSSKQRGAEPYDSQT